MVRPQNSLARLGSLGIAIQIQVELENIGFAAPIG